jgi:hypothetical protein
MKSRIIVGLIVGLAISSSASAAPVFFDGFEGDSPALSVATLANFTVTGKVDVVAAANTYSIAAYSGNVIDLDGSPGPGSIGHAPISFAAGDKVTLSFVVGGSQRSSAFDDFLLGFTFGGALISDVSTSGVFASFPPPSADGSLSTLVAGGAGYQPSTFSFTALTGGAFGFSFGTTSGDNIGPLLDSVGLDITPVAVPGPVVGAGLPGFIIALGALVALRRRRMAAA